MQRGKRRDPGSGLGETRGMRGKDLGSDMILLDAKFAAAARAAFALANK